jgi:hypothetical protein
MRVSMLIAGLLTLAGNSAFAADAAPQGRYTLTPNGAGFVRLDTQTGQVSECTGAPANLICKSTPDERAALMAEIDRLQGKIDAWDAAAPAPAADQQSLELNLPDDKQVDKAFNFLERMIKRFKGLVEEMRKEPSQSTPL